MVGCFAARLGHSWGYVRPANVRAPLPCLALSASGGGVFFFTMRFSLLLPWLLLPCYALIDVVRVTLWLLLLFFLLAYKGISVDRL